MRHKVGVIGAGNVGGTLTQRLVESGWADVVLLDIADDFARGKAFDLEDSRMILGNAGNVMATSNYAALSGAEVVVITAGLARQQGMSREDLLKKNAAVVKGVTAGIMAHCPEAVILVVTNPLDILTNLILRESKLPPSRVIGMGGLLDASRFANLISKELNVTADDIRAMVIGAHGKQMIPLPRYTTVSGIPLTELLAANKLKTLLQLTVDRGAEIVALLGRGSAYYAPSAAAFSMVKAVLNDEQKIVPSCVYCSGVYGVSGVCIGVPARLGIRGVEEIVELELTPEELECLKAAAETVKNAAERL